ncbi:MAG: LEA type 2 family protein [Candidatus Latescibacterota bacterium]
MSTEAPGSPGGTRRRAGLPVAALVVVLAALLLPAGCTLLQNAGQARKPRLSVQSVRITGLSFQQLDLVVDVGVDNPNPLPVRLAGLDWELRIADRSFLAGRQIQETQIDAAGRSTVSVPLILDYAQLQRAYQSLQGQDSTAYELELGLDLQVPVLGLQHLSLEHQGTVPVLRPPRVEGARLQVRSLSLTGADLDLQLQVDNPNPFGLLLESVDYRLTVAGELWADGTRRQAVRVGGETTQLVAVPVSISFLGAGRSIYKALSGEEALPYELSGTLDLGTTLSLLPHATLPLQLQGTLPVRR